MNKRVQLDTQGGEEREERVKLRRKEKKERKEERGGGEMEDGRWEMGTSVLCVCGDYEWPGLDWTGGNMRHRARDEREGDTVKGRER